MAHRSTTPDGYLHDPARHASAPTTCAQRGESTGALWGPRSDDANARRADRGEHRVGAGNSFGKHHVKALGLAAKHSVGASVLGKLSFSLPAKKVAKLHIHLSKATRKQLKNLASLKAILTVQLKLGKAKKRKKYSDPIVLFGPKAKKQAPSKKLSHNLRRLLRRWRGRGFGSGWTCLAAVGSRATRRQGGSFWLVRRIRLSSLLRRSTQRSRGGISRICTILS